MGNHELMMVRAIGGKDDLAMWIRAGGAWTLESYGHCALSIDCAELRSLIPYEHMVFLAECHGFYEDSENIFVHANYEWDADMDRQTEKASFWTHLNEHSIPSPHKSGKTVWVGHTPQRSGQILDLGHIVCLDTYGFRTGWVTAVEVTTRHMWQANEKGELRYTCPELNE
jgi:serine/threonine protein phosphatase 1